MSTKRFKSWLVVGGGALLLAVATTAGVALGSPARSDKGSPIDQAAAKGTAAGRAHFSFMLSITGGKGLPAGGITLGGKGGFDSKQKTGEFTLDLGALAASLGAVTGGKANSIPKSIEIITINGVVYIHLSAFAKQLGPGKEWLKIDPKTLPKTATRGVNPSSFTKLDAQQVLAKLAGSVSVKKIGTATITGATTTQYRATVDLTKLIASFVPASQAAQAAKAQQALAKAGLKTIPVDFYIGPLGFIRRVSLVLSNLKVQAGTPPVSIKMTLDFSDWGTATINVTAPPAAKTADAAKLLGSLLGGTTG
jgi:hypothetical protein